MNELAIARRRRDTQRGNQLGNIWGNTYTTPQTGTTYTPPVYSPTYNTPTYSPTVTYPTSAPQSSGNTVHYFNTIANLVSQTLSGWSRNPTNQVTSQGAVISNPAVLMTQAQNQPQQYGPSIQNYPGGSAGSALGSGVDGILGWATQNPLIVLLGVGGVLLLFRDPPRGRR